MKTKLPRVTKSELRAAGLLYYFLAKAKGNKDFNPLTFVDNKLDAEAYIAELSERIRNDFKKKTRRKK
jgi:hypothetical protein